MRYQRTRKRKIKKSIIFYFFVGIFLIGGYLIFSNIKIDFGKDKKAESHFNEKEFRNKLISSERLKSELKHTYPDIQITKTKKSGFAYPSDLVEWEIDYGENIPKDLHNRTLSVTIRTYQNESSYLFDGNVFKELNGNIESIFISGYRNDFPVNGTDMRELLSTISKGLNRPIDEASINSLTTKLHEEMLPFYNSKGNDFRKEKMGSQFSYQDITYHYTASKPSPWAESLESYIPVYTISIDILDQDNAEKAYKALYKEETNN